MHKLVFKFSFIILACLLMGLPALSYTDVTPKDWSYDAINELTTKYGILAGYPNNKFKPKSPITREETAAELYRIVQWVEAHPASVSVQDLQRVNMLLNEYRSELMQVQNEVRSLHQEQDLIKARVDQIDARLDWNLKNRGLSHMVLMGGGKALVGAGKDVLSVGKGAVWLFTLGKVNLFENPNVPPDPIDKTNRYNGPVQFVNGSAF